jgi:phospholipid/cholesterol/gamma-HCH transport system substrate-binding protein
MHLRSVPGVGRNAAVAALSVLIALAAGGYMMSKASFVPPFGRQIIRAEFSSVPGTNVAITHKVTIAGVEVGTITATEATHQGTAILDMNIGSQYKIYNNARAVLTTINPLNEMYIELAPGGPPAPVLPDSGLIPIGQTSQPVQADNVLDHLDQRSQHALTALLADSTVALARAPQQLPAGIDATDKTVIDLKPVAEKLQSRRELLRDLVSALSQIATAAGGNQQRIVQLANSTQQALGVLADNDQQLQDSLDQLPGLNDQLRHALGSTQDLTRQLNPTLRDLSAASHDLPPALQDATDTAEQLGHTVHTAEPLVADARPVVADLRPFVSDLNDALGDTIPITHALKRSTGLLTSYLNDATAFVFNTSSVFGIKDGQSGFIRAYLTEPAPDFGSLSGQHGPVSSRRPDGDDSGQLHHPNPNTQPTLPGLGGYGGDK